ncbi:MAG: Flp pilus assembly complex ATPase component TadA [Armatimonadetes bacterium]|nr:Flp pilus assembly complex ATPase component TadA [Armatimonadota bacterium]
MNVEELFTTMVERRASHLHLVPGSPIMMRQQKRLEPLDGHVLSPQDTRAIAEAIMDEQLLDSFEENLETDFSFSVPGLSRFRVNCFRQRGSVAIVISTNPPAPPTIEELGLPDILKQLIIETDSGLIMITGPKSAGKAHTLAALVNYVLEMRTCQVLSIENPIDFLHKNKKGIICQREIGTDTLSYESAFKSLLHQGADVVVITGVDEFTAVERVLNLAAGGNLVLCTANSPSALVLIEKMVDLYPPHLHQQARTLLSVGLRSVIAQQLLPRVSGDGLVPCFEILLGTPQVKQLIREGKFFQIASVMATSGREEGMLTQEMSLRQLVKKNLVSEDEAYRRAANPESFKKIMSLPY